METMNSLGAPLEALAFNNPSYGGFLSAVNNVWAWAAVLTAAVGYWRIKSSAMSAQPDPRPEFRNGSSDPPAPPRDIALSSPPPAKSPSVSAPGSTTSDEATTGLTKGEKFTAFFNGDDAIDGDAGGGDDFYKNRNGGDGDGLGPLVDEWYKSWKGAIETRSRGAGWYRNQDLTAINGNVVRLWDRSRRRRWSTAAAVGVGCVVSW